jgi:hypothetical protein
MTWQPCLCRVQSANGERLSRACCPGCLILHRTSICRTQYPSYVSYEEWPLVAQGLLLQRGVPGNGRMACEGCSTVRTYRAGLHQRHRRRCPDRSALCRERVADPAATRHRSGGSQTARGRAGIWPPLRRRLVERPSAPGASLKITNAMSRH